MIEILYVGRPRELLEDGMVYERHLERASKLSCIYGKFYG